MTHIIHPAIPILLQFHCIYHRFVGDDAACKCRMCQNSFRGTNCGTWQIASPTSSEFTTSALCIYCSFLSHVVCSERVHLLKHPLTGIWYRMAFAFFVKRIQRLTNEGMTNLTRKCCFSKHGFLYVQHCKSLVCLLGQSFQYLLLLFICVSI